MDTQKENPYNSSNLFQVKGGYVQNPVVNILEYKSEPKNSKPYGTKVDIYNNVRTDSPQNRENDFSKFQRSTYDEVENIEEEQILVQKIIEYSIPNLLECDEQNKLFQSRCPANIQHGIEEPNRLWTLTDDQNINFPYKMFNNFPDTYNNWGDSYTPFSQHSSKKVPSLMKFHGFGDSNGNSGRSPPVRKYSPTFLTSECVLEQLNQQNIMAQRLLDQYFETKNIDTNCNLDFSKSATSPPNIHVRKRSKDYLENPESQTVSALLKTHFYCSEKGEQVCLKPSEQFVFLKEGTEPKKDLFRSNHSVKFVRPYKYHKNFWESGSNVNLITKKDTSGDFEEPVCKKSRLDFDSNVALDQDSSKDINSIIGGLSSSQMPFLNTKNYYESDMEVNKILFKNDSKNLANANSYEEMPDKNAFFSERYMSLRNLYSYNYLDPSLKNFNRPQYNFQRMMNDMRERSSRHLSVRCLDSGSHIKVTDDEYRAWVKKNNFQKYANVTNSTLSTITTTLRSVSQKVVNYSVTPCVDRKKDTQLDRKRKRSRYNSLDLVSRDSLLELDYDNLYQLFIYEHIATSNFLNFMGCFSGIQRLKKLSIVDRMLQVTFFITCYYVILFMNAIFATYNEKWF